MKQKIKNAVVTLINCTNLLAKVFLCFCILGMSQGLPYVKAMPAKKVKELAKNTFPLMTPEGRRYCTASVVNFRNNNYTLTNMHCCDSDVGFGREFMRVGNVVERILLISQIADVCILTSSRSQKGLKLAKKDLEVLDQVLLLGHPRGEFLTPRYGFAIALNEWVTVDYGYGEYLTRPSHYISALSFPGNSGSPVFNHKGEVVGLLYAGPNPIFQYGVIVPYRYIVWALEAADRSQGE